MNVAVFFPLPFLQATPIGERALLMKKRKKQKRKKETTTTNWMYQGDDSLTLSRVKVIFSRFELKKGHRFNSERLHLTFDRQMKCVYTP